MLFDVQWSAEIAWPSIQLARTGFKKSQHNLGHALDDNWHI